MKKTGKFTLVIFSVLLALIFCSSPCFAVSLEGNLLVKLEDENENLINDMKVSVTKIADLNGTDYILSKEFKDSGISIDGIVDSPSEATARDILKYIKKNKIVSVSKTSEYGKAQFENLSEGIWLVFCEDSEKYSFNPYLVFLPFANNGGLNYNVTSTPKLKLNKLDDKSIYVIKKWDDNNNEAKKRPEKITVELKRGEKVVDTVVLNEGNGWAHTFEGQSNEGKYSVNEKMVKNYSVKYSGDSENGFIITNTYNSGKLPQTGQLWWPIGIVLFVGLLFVLLGIIELGARKNEEKK